MYPDLSQKDFEECQERHESVDLLLSSEKFEKRVKTTYRIVLSTLFVTICGIIAIWVLVSTYFSPSSSRPCSNPVVRREWRQLNTSEKSNYISAVKCLQTYSSITTGVGRLSDDFPWVHRRMNQYSKFIVVVE